jgi:hypothetical protein
MKMFDDKDSSTVILSDIREPLYVSVRAQLYDYAKGPWEEAEARFQDFEPTQAHATWNALVFTSKRSAGSQAGTA